MYCSSMFQAKSSYNLFCYNFFHGEAGTRMQLEMENLKHQLNNTSSGASSSEIFSPTEPAVRKTAAKSHPKPKEPAPHCGDGQPPPETEAARNARLRRICERKPSGKIYCSQELHDRWKQGTKEDREALVELLESCDWNKAHNL